MIRAEVIVHTLSEDDMHGVLDELMHNAAPGACIDVNVYEIPDDQAPETVRSFFRVVDELSGKR